MTWLNHMAHFTTNVFLVLCICPYYGITTRFLPMIVWDHLNPQLRCQCNWPVIPHTDLYDRLEFVCPTLKIAMNQLDGYSRPEGDMNENIFRRKWTGSEDELRDNIHDGSIQTFCDPNKSTLIHTCRNGQYSSTAVTFKYSKDETKNYEISQFYVFYNNADDGRESSLTNRNTNCTMLFVVYVSHKEGVEHDFTFGKRALSQTCKCNQQPINSCSTLSNTVVAQTTAPNTIRSSIQPSTTSITQKTKMTKTSDPTTITTSDTRTQGRRSSEMITQNSLVSSTEYQPTTKQSRDIYSQTTDLRLNAKETCPHPWISTWLLVIFATSTALLPITVCWLICVIRRSPKRPGLNSNGSLYYTQPKEGEGEFVDNV